MRSLPAALCCAALLACSRPVSEPAAAPAAAQPAAQPAGAAPPATDAGSVVAADPPEAQQARAELVSQIETLERPWGDPRFWDPKVLSALRRVPRHLFVPGLSLAAAYADVPQPIGHDQTISQPTVVALMTQALLLTGTERVLEIGTGSGYQAAVLSLLCREVLSLELVEPLGRAAARRLAELGYANVAVRIGDGYQGWPEKAPFDRIMVTAAPPALPAALVEQLAPGGIIVAPVGVIGQQLVRWTRRGEKIEKEELGPVRFVPMVRPGAEIRR